MNARATDVSPSIDPNLAKLQRDGFCVIPNLLAAEQIAKLDDDLAPNFKATPFCEGNFYGPRTIRFGRLLSRSVHARNLVMHPAILDIAEAILGPWADTVQLNLTQAIALHPGAPAQFPHRDQDMWRGEIGEKEYLLNVMWPFTDYRKDNGTTLIYPRSHGAAALQPEPVEAPRAIEVGPGSALLFLGSTLHGAGANRSNDVRRGAIVSYCLGWLKPYENQWLAYPPQVARSFDRELAAMVGYRQHRPNLGNYEGQCPSVLLTPDEPPLNIGAIDALRPDQEAMLDEYYASGESGPALE